MKKIIIAGAIALIAVVMLVMYQASPATSQQWLTQAESEYPRQRVPYPAWYWDDRDDFEMERLEMLDYMYDGQIGDADVFTGIGTGNSWACDLIIDEADQWQFACTHADGGIYLLAWGAGWTHRGVIPEPVGDDY